MELVGSGRNWTQPGRTRSNWEETGWIWEELGGSGRNWVDLEGTGWEMGGNWVNLGGTGRKLGKSGWN